MELQLGPIADFDPTAWDALVPGYPFLRHAFYRALEDNGCTTPESGWQPLHMGCLDKQALAAVIPAYVKGHSHGEFVYDWHWAAAYGESYYPKLYLGPPFTPAIGPRLLGAQPERSVRLLVGLLEQLGLSSVHLNGATDCEQELLSAAGFLLRPMWQYHWHNHGYSDFDDFLSRLKRQRRKTIGQERRRLSRRGWRFERIPGRDVSAQQWKLMASLYARTFMEKGNWPNLNAGFFADLGAALGDQTMLVLATADDGEPTAAAFFLHSERVLYGRYWGSLGEEPFLHFETCYYQGIEYAIEQGLERFEPGVFGQHKLARGFEPVEVYSAHYFSDARFAAAVRQWLKADAPRHQAEGDALARQVVLK